MIRVAIKESTLAIGDVAVAESDPNAVWVGTGEVLMARSSYAGTGVFNILDSGETCSSPWPHCGVSRPPPSRHSSGTPWPEPT